jgi:hypothetical protein
MVSQAMMSVVVAMKYRLANHQRIKSSAIAFLILLLYTVIDRGHRGSGSVSKRETEVWLQSFTNTQKGVIYTSLLTNAKDWLRKKYFPSGGTYPSSLYAELLGLPPDMSGYLFGANSQMSWQYHLAEVGYNMKYFRVT